MNSTIKNITRERVIEILGVKPHPTDKTTDKGMLMGQLPKVSEHCYLYQLNDPASLDAQAKICEISRHADADFLAEIFGCMNGMNVFRSIFSLYGWIEGLNRGDLFTTQNVPFNIVDIQLDNRPHQAPREGCVVSTLKTSVADDKRSTRVVDVIMPNKTIVGGYFYKDAKIIDEFDDVEQWLINRFKLAYDLYEEEYMNFLPR